MKIWLPPTCIREEMNLGLFWKMGEQMVWIRNDFMEQLCFSSTILMLGHCVVSFFQNDCQHQRSEQILLSHIPF